MAIAAKPNRVPNDGARRDPMEFIQGAERQAGESPEPEISPLRRENKEPVIIRFEKEIIARLDKAAIKRGLSRAALVRLLVMENLPD